MTFIVQRIAVVAPRKDVWLRGARIGSRNARRAPKDLLLLRSVNCVPACGPLLSVVSPCRAKVIEWFDSFFVTACVSAVRYLCVSIQTGVLDPPFFLCASLNFVALPLRRRPSGGWTELRSAAFPQAEGDRRETLGTLIYHKGVFDPSNPCIEGHSIRKMPVDNINSANTNQAGNADALCQTK